MKIIIDIEGCRNCPYKHHHRGHGEDWEECSHPQAPGGYASIVNPNNKTGFAAFCPLVKDQSKSETI